MVIQIMNTSRFYKEIKKLFFENKSIKQTLFKNTAWLSVSEFITRFFTISLTIFIARILGAENYGLLSFAISYTGLFSVLSDFGIQTIIIREINQKEEAKNELGAVLWLKIILGIIVLVFIIGSSFFIKNNAAQLMVVIFAAVVFINTVSSFFTAIFQAFQKMEYIAITEISKAVTLFVGGFLVLFIRPDINFIAYIYFLSAFLGFIIILFIAKRLSVLPLPVLDRKIVKKYLSLSWPLALSTVFITIYAQIDSVMMGFWGMIKEVGWYQAADKITNFVIFPGVILGTVFYPALSQAYSKGKDYFQKIIDSFSEALIFFAFPIVVGGLLLSRRIIISFYSEEFLPSILAFQILIFTSGLTLFIILINYVLNTAGHQKKIFYITGSTALLDIILNFILIPKYSLYGAAVATLISYIFLFLFGFIVLKRININIMSSLRTIFISILAVSIMAVFLYSGTIQNINVILQVLIAGSLYSLFFFTIKTFFKKLVVLK